MQVGMSCLRFSVLVLRRSKVCPSWLSFCWRLLLEMRAQVKELHYEVGKHQRTAYFAYTRKAFH